MTAGSILSVLNWYLSPEVNGIAWIVIKFCVSWKEKEELQNNDNIKYLTNKSN